MATPQYDDVFVKNLFDRMGRTYDLVNLLSSFGFSEFWRWRCVANLPMTPGAEVCDMMAGTGECWPYIRRCGGAAIISIDFSPAMVARQKRRRCGKGLRIDARCENAVSTSIPSASVDFVVGAFCLKTLDLDAVKGFADEIRRILRPGGHFSLIEISVPENRALAKLYRWDVNSVIPMIGRLCLGDIACYRMLGVYTEAFGSCARIASVFQESSLTVTVKRHFYGCASSLVGYKAMVR